MNAKRTFKSLLPLYRTALRGSVGARHVSESAIEVTRAVLRGPDGRWARFRTLPRYERRAIVAAIVREHRANQDLFRHVARGSY